jgi:hypothetical protein
MTNRLALSALLSALPAVLSAQSPPICDGSEMRRLEHRRRFGGVLAASVLAVDLVGEAYLLATLDRRPGEAAMATAEVHFRKTIALALGSVPIVAFGYYLHANSYPTESFWQQTLARMKIGETRSTDVRACLHAPSGVTSSIADREEQWTYYAARPDPRRHGVRTVSFTFKDSVLADVRRSETRLPVGLVWPETVPVVPVVEQVPPSP